jgi:hypothetical protein
VGAGSPVIDVADDVQPGDGLMLDKLRQGDDERLCAARRDDGFDDALIIVLFVCNIFLFEQQFLDDTSKMLGQESFDCGSRVLGRNNPADSEGT